VALLKRRFGAHLSDAARETLAGRRPYPSLAAIRNPLTRPIARRIAASDWRATHEQIDFPHSLQDETIAGVPCVVCRPETIRAEAPVILYLHAGGFVAGSARDNATAVLPTCHLSECEAIAIDYSLAPEAVYPQQQDEIERVYRDLLATGRNPGKIVLVGDSAGGALALAALYRWRRLGLPLPAGVSLLSPVLDADTSSDTHHTLRGRDPLFASNGQESCAESFRLYAGDADISDPEISPLNGDPAGLPPILIQVGTREILLGDSARFSGKARRAGVDVSLHVFDGMFHLFHQHWRLADAKSAHQDIAAFVRRVAG
jgi:acetyl esterase/lipase